MSKLISARIDNSLHDKLLEQCNKDGKTVNETVKEILNQSLDGSSTCSSTINTQEIIDNEVLNDYKQKNNEISEKIDQISQAVTDLANGKATKNEVNSLRQKLDKIPIPFHRGVSCFKEAELD
jgi:methyl-accepting chemotaxis protein